MIDNTDDEIARLRAEAAADLKHADALEAWGARRVVEPTEPPATEEAADLVRNYAAEIAELQRQVGYWRQRCENAEERLRRVGKE